MYKAGLTAKMMALLVESRVCPQTKGGRLGEMKEIFTKPRIHKEGRQAIR